MRSSVIQIRVMKYYLLGDLYADSDYWTSQMEPLDFANGPAGLCKWVLDFANGPAARWTSQMGAGLRN